MRTTTSLSRGPSSSRRSPTPRDPEPLQAPLEDHRKCDDEEGRGFFEEANTAGDNIIPLPHQEDALASFSRTPKPSGTTAPPPITSYLPVHRPLDEPPQPRGNSMWLDKLPGSQSSRHSDEDGDRNWNYGLPRGGPPGADQPSNRQPANAQAQQEIFEFEKTIEVPDVPTWDGNGDTILDWLDHLNHISSLSQSIYNDLGLVAPLRLTDAAARWFYALDPPQQQYTQQNWGNFKLALSTYFMNPQWFDRMKTRSLRMYYRQKGHEQELPCDYFHRKLRMIQEVFVQTPSETIMEIMNGAPRYWSILIDTSRINTIVDLQYRIKCHEAQLVCNPATQTQDLEKRIKALESRSHQRF